MTFVDLRNKYINFFLERGHSEISGRSIIPDNDPTVLFTTAGMQPLVPFIEGEPHPAGTRLVNCQRCLRTGDIDAVGDLSHNTYFEMLGNWSLGAYFKQESLEMSHEFLTSPAYLNIAPSTLRVSIFAGDAEINKDQEAYEIWRSLGIPAAHIYALPREDNWWGPAGLSGPCGPDSEIFIDTGIAACGADCRPGCSCPKYFEVWNNVFMEYEKDATGAFLPLKRKCIDTGMGVERTIAMLQGFSSVYDSELFRPILTKLEELSNKQYSNEDPLAAKSFRIIADHIRSSVMIFVDEMGVLPSNLGRGYILRRLIRRAVRHAKKLDIRASLAELVSVIADIYSPISKDIKEKQEYIARELRLEEENFQKTLANGEHEFYKILTSLDKNSKKIIPGDLAFKLYDTYGFPLELTQELAAEHALQVDHEAFDTAFKRHREVSKKGANRAFKGGLADNSEMTTAYHTTTHLLHEALRLILGSHVEQKGSNITAERLRFDFSHEQPLSEEEKKAVEDLVNEQIQRDLPISKEDMQLSKAQQIGARALFAGRYDEKVSVYKIGDFSLEVCGGPHVHATGKLGYFKITKEQSSARGIRRIRAILTKEN